MTDAHQPVVAAPDRLEFVRAEVQDHLALGFDRVPGLIEIRAFKDISRRQKFCIDQAQALGWIGRFAVEGFDVFTGCATRLDSSSGRKDNLRAVRTLWADCDCKVEGDAEVFRIRLEEFKSNANVVWQVFMDIDADDVLDFAIQLDAKADD